MSPSLDEALASWRKQELASLEKTRTTLQEQIDAKRQELIVTSAEAERSARDILQTARDQAATLVQEAERLRKDANEKLQSVEARERAVEWMKDEQAKVEAKAAALAKAQAIAEQARIAGITQQELYAAKLAELKSWEEQLAKQAATTVEPPPPIVEPPNEPSHIVKPITEP